jgi:cytoskeletal protein CcmA (bactofilin family)
LFIEDARLEGLEMTGDEVVDDAIDLDGLVEGRLFPLFCL